MQTGGSIYRQMVKEQGHFYVCGDVSMASDVSDKLETILVVHGHMTKHEAKAFVVKLRVCHHYILFVYSYILQHYNISSVIVIMLY